MTGVSETRGTWRARPVNETWALIEPLLKEYGISRVASVTGFDRLGVPVAVAARPRATTLSTSQGKGQSRRHSFVSAAMEAIELSCAERPSFQHTIHEPASELRLGYDVSSLDTAERALVHDVMLTPQYWMPAELMTSKESSWLPVSAVSLASGPTSYFRPTFFRLTTNGLASGNTVAEARFHALLEVIERHVLATSNERISYDVRSVPSELIQRLVSIVGVSISIRSVPNPFGMHVFESVVTSEDYPLLAVGSGAHPDPLVAVQRAVTEAAQSRLTAIVGTREDVNPDPKAFADDAQPPRAEFAGNVSWSAASQPIPKVDFDEAVTALAGEVADRTGVAPMACTLHERTELAVVRVVAPGTVFTGARNAVGEGTRG